VATGFLFKEMNRHACADTLRRAVTLYRDPKAWRRVQIAALGRDFSWANSAQEYLALYRSLVV
jgi:starch synthase